VRGAALHSCQRIAPRALASSQGNARLNNATPFWSCYVLKSQGLRTRGCTACECQSAGVTWAFLGHATSYILLATASTAAPIPRGIAMNSYSPCPVRSSLLYIPFVHRLMGNSRCCRVLPYGQSRWQVTSQTLTSDHKDIALRRSIDQLAARCVWLVARLHSVRVGAPASQVGDHCELCQACRRGEAWHHRIACHVDTPGPARRCSVRPCLCRPCSLYRDSAVSD
jgi:hypothetical protein